MTSQYIEAANELSIIYPDAPDGVAGSIPAVIWGKLESYVNSRWSTAVVEYQVTCPCAVDWRPPYYPFTIDTVAGDPAEVNQFGEVRLTAGRHKVVCTVGGLQVDDGIKEAYRRLAEYYGSEDLRGYARYSVSLGGEIQESWSRRKDATALSNSGAADLLTKYRKAGLAHV